MSIILSIQSKQDDGNILHLIKSAIQAEIARLKLGLDMAAKRLLPFEKKYGISSEQFMSQFTAEDLEGGDDEYVNWAGEYQLKQRLEQKLAQLNEIEYDRSGILQSYVKWQN